MNFPTLQGVLEPSEIAAITYILVHMAPHADVSHREVCLLSHFLECFLIRVSCVGYLASKGSLSFCFLRGDSILSPHVAWSLAIAIYQLWLLLIRHDITQNLKHVQLFTEGAICPYCLHSPGRSCRPRVVPEKGSARREKICLQGRSLKNILSEPLPSCNSELQRKN